MLPRKAPVTAALAISLFAGSALANGRFPNAQQLRELDNHTLVLVGTYGMLVTTNGGVDFAYQCEAELFGKPTGSYTVDPLLEAGPDGAIFSGSLHGLRVSRDRSCTFETEPSVPRNWSFFELERPPDAENGVVVDVCRRGGDSNAPVLALVAMKDDASQTTEHRLYESDAAGVFSAVGAPIAVSMLDYGLTLDVAPSDPDRIYVSGTLTNDPVLVVSDDGGTSFRSLPLAFDDADFVMGAYLGAVAPDDPERVYLRVARRVQTDDGLYFRDDSLAVSSDGGESFDEVLREPANLLGFSLSLDGSVVLAGYGDPRVDETLSSRDAVGIYRAGANELVFERIVSDVDVSCLRATSNGLYACAVERDPLGLDPTFGDFHLGLYSGSGEPASAADFTPILALRNVRGPAPWADGRTTACQVEWKDPASPLPLGTCARLNACDGQTDLSEGALVCGVAGGGGGAGEGAGAAGGTGAVGESGDGPREAGGCGCRAGQQGSKTTFLWLAFCVLAFGCRAGLRRRARRGAVIAAVLGVTLGWVPGAHANGRFPNAQQVRELGSRALAVTGTYGLLVTTNGGKDFAYVCESEMFGKFPGAATMDPLLELAPDGSFVTGSLQAARVSLGGGCGFETIASLPRNFEFLGEDPPAGATPGRVADLSRRGTNAGAPLLALVSLVDEAGIPIEHRVYEARSGTDFSPLGEPIPPDLVEFVLTLDAAPSDPNRLYVSGHRAREPVLARSSDGGQSWEAVLIPVADVEGVLGTYLAAVSPSDADRIYLRSSRRRFDENGFYLWDDSLLVSDDAGDSFSEPIRHAAALLGFALRDGGETVLCGYGDPRAEAAVSIEGELGIYAANGLVAADELAFERIVADIDVNCLHAMPAGLYACATEVDPLGTDPALEPDFHLGLFTGPGLPEARADFTPIAKLRDVRGPPPRADGSAGPCDTEWQATCGALFACDNDPRELDEGALVCGDGAGGAGGGGAGSGGEGGADEDRRAMWQGAYTCSCRHAGKSPGGPGWLFAIFVVWWHRFRKKCRPSSS